MLTSSGSLRSDPGLNPSQRHFRDLCPTSTGLEARSHLFLRDVGGPREGGIRSCEYDGRPPRSSLITPNPDRSHLPRCDSQTVPTGVGQFLSPLEQTRDSTVETHILGKRDPGLPRWAPSDPSTHKDPSPSPGGRRGTPSRSWKESTPRRDTRLVRVVH